MTATQSAHFDDLRSDIEGALEAYLNKQVYASPPLGPRGKLREAMRYSVLGGGKRLRPLLCCAVCLDLNGDHKNALPAACAVEFIHAYSLIHDDLPSMDNDKMRRGKATSHIAFGEATAILAGDALQSLAFDVLAHAENLNNDTRIELVQLLSTSAGAQGMVGGQNIDMQATNTSIGLAELEQLHSAKTGALIKAAILSGAISTNADQATLALLEIFGYKLGLAFQVVDDILDETQSSETLGKQAGSDRQLGKNTFPHLMGLAAAQKYAEALERSCFEVLAQLDIQDGYLATLVTRIIHRVS